MVFLKRKGLKLFAAILFFFTAFYVEAKEPAPCKVINEQKDTAFFIFHKKKQTIDILNTMRPQFNLYNFCIFTDSLPVTYQNELSDNMKINQFKKNYEDSALKNKIISVDLSKTISLKGETVFLFFGDQIKNFLKIFGIEQYYFESDFYKRAEEMRGEADKKILIEISFRI